VERHSSLLLAILLLGLASAQQQPLFDRISVEDGLPGRQVLALHQDRQGLVWIGTDNGLARYEVVRIRTWHHDRSDTSSLANEQVNTFAEDASGNLWIGTAHGISRLDAGRSSFRNHRLPAPDQAYTRANRVDDLLCTADGRVWASTEAGLYALDPATGETERLLPAADGYGPPGTRVLPRALVHDTLRQGIWLGTNAGLVFHHLPSGAWYSHRNDPLGWGCFSDAPAGTPLPLRDGGLLWFDQRALALIHDQLNGTRHVVDHLNGDRIAFTPRLLAQDPDGTLWLSTWTYRLYRLSADLGQALRIADTPGLPGAMVENGPYSTLLDQSGVRWFGTAQGLALLAPWRQGLEVLHPMPGRTLMGPLAQRGDTLLVGTLESGLLVVDLRRNEARAIPATGTRDGAARTWSQRTTCALHLHGPHYLIGSGHGLLWLDLHRSTLVPAEQRMALPDRLTSASISRLVRDAHGGVWVGTWAHGAFRLDPDGPVAHYHWEATDDASRLPLNGVLDLLVARSGDVWMGLNDGGGLVRLPGGTGPARHMDKAGNAQSLYAVVTALAEAPDGAIWAGTHQGGLDRLELATGQWTPWSRRNGLPSDRVGGVAVDPAGGVWAVTSAGLAHLPAGAERFVAVHPPRGVDPLRFHSRTLLLHDGRLAVGNGDHLLLAQTAGAAQGQPVPGIRVVAVQHGDGAFTGFHGGEVLRLPYDRRSLVVEVAATGLAATRDILFRYRIPGLVEAEADMSAAGRLDLIDLPAGLHRIHLSASADGRHWSDRPAVLTVEVLPPFWATGWFRALVLLVVAVLVLLAVRIYVLRRLTTQRIAFEREQALLAERVRIASDMHDDLGAGLSGLKLRTELAARMEQDPGKRAQLGQLATMAGELIGNMRRLIWTMDGGQGTVDDLVAYCANYARQYLSEHGIACVVEVPGALPALQVRSEQRRNVFLLIKEALHNVVKHAGARQVTLHFVLAEGDLLVEVSDDGVGLNGSADAHAPGLGLRSMRQRMESIGGRFSSGKVAHGPGTRITGRIPLAGE